MYTTFWQLRADPRAGGSGFVYKTNQAAAPIVYKNTLQLRRSGRRMYTYEFTYTHPGSYGITG